MIDDIKFVHPRDMLERTILITGNDVTMCLSYVEGEVAVDHHPSQIISLSENDNHIIDPEVPPSVCAVFGRCGAKADVPTVSLDMLEAVDKGDPESACRRSRQS